MSEVVTIEVTASVSCRADERALAGLLADYAVGGTVGHVSKGGGMTTFVLEIEAGDADAAKAQVEGVIEGSKVSAKKLLLQQPKDQILH